MRRGMSQQQRTLRAVLLIVLAGATHLLVTQLCRGEVPRAAEQRFVPPVGGLRVMTLEFRSEAVVAGAEIRLKDVVRFGDAVHDMGDLEIARFEGAASSRSVGLTEVKQTLQGAGVHLGSLNFGGSLVCKVTRTTTSPPVTAPLLLSNVASATAERPAAVAVSRTLRDILVEELAGQLNVGSESLQVRFEQRDERVLNLAGPAYSFDIEPRKQRRLGDVSWDLFIVNNGDRQRVSIRAHARVWQTQVLAAKPVVFKQELRAEDLSERRVLTDRVSEEPALGIEQVIGQSAARDITVGSIITSKMLEPPACARVNQFINVTVEQGSVRVGWVAEARESGARGQAIRVRKPGTREEFTVLLTGPEQGKLLGPATAAASKLIARN